MGEIINEENYHNITIEPKINPEPIFHPEEPFYTNCEECGSLYKLFPEDLVIKSEKRSDWGRDYDNRYYRYFFFPTYICSKCKKECKNFSYSYKHDGKNILPDYENPYVYKNQYRKSEDINIKLIPDYIRYKNHLRLEIEQYRIKVLDHSGFFKDSRKRISAEKEMKEAQEILYSFEKYPLIQENKRNNIIYREAIQYEIKNLHCLFLSCKDEITRRRYERQRNSFNKNLRENEIMLEEIIKEQYKLKR